jgi:CTP:molybdopterin cytidylyltransferase MocA
VTLAAIVIAAYPIAGSDDAPALLPWSDDDTLIEYEIGQLLEAFCALGEPPAIEVVLGCDAEHIIPLVAADNVEPIVDPLWQSDAASALRVGAAAVPRGTTTALVCDVTQPRTAARYTTLVDHHRERRAAVTRASHDGAPGWPAIIDEAVLAEMRNLAPHLSLDSLLAPHAGATLLVPTGAGEPLVTIASATDLRRLQKSI